MQASEEAKPSEGDSPPTNPRENKTEPSGAGQAAPPHNDSSSDMAALAGALEEKKSKDADDSDDDDAEIVEESPCGRWLKRREKVKYRDVPGVETAYLAMDSEEGVEVVWNEAQLSTSKKSKAQEDKLQNIFEALTLIDHPNIVRFHKYWTDTGSGSENGEKTLPRVIFITEYMSSGSLKQFLRRTKKNNRKIQLQSWKRWCTQILSALSYLHETCDPPITHGNLTCDTIFIQHNGLVKIGSIAPDIIHHNVKTISDSIKNLHYLAPEWGDSNYIPGPPSDIYSFGMCALETAALDILTTANEGDAVGKDVEKEGEKSGGTINEETIQRTIDQLEDELQKDFIRKCLRQRPEDRPSARQLLFHPVLFEVHSLKLLAAHSLVNTPEVDTSNINEAVTDEAIQSHYGLDTVMATLTKGGVNQEFKLSNVPVAEKLEKFMEDVKFGIYPITAFALSQPPPPKTRAVSPESQQDNPQGVAGDNQDFAEEGKELRRINQMLASIGAAETKGYFNLIVIARLEDGMNRQLTCQVTLDEGPEPLADELIGLNFISELDRQLVLGLFADVFRKLAVKSAQDLSEQLNETSVINVNNGKEANGDSHKHENGEALISDSDFAKLQYFFPDNITDKTKEMAKNPHEAANMRDPTFITERYPMPEGAFFCPPALEDGSEPFKVPPPGTNAFDCSHLEAQEVVSYSPSGLASAPSVSASVSASASTSAASELIFTSKGSAGPDPTYDPYAYLQGAQKALEGLSLSQQQQLQQQQPQATHHQVQQPEDHDQAQKHDNQTK